MNYHKHKSIKNYYCVHDTERNMLMYINANTKLKPIQKFGSSHGIEKPLKNRENPFSVIGMSNWEKSSYIDLHNEIKDFELKMLLFENEIV